MRFEFELLGLKHEAKIEKGNPVPNLTPVSKSLSSIHHPNMILPRGKYDYDTDGSLVEGHNGDIDE